MATYPVFLALASAGEIRPATGTDIPDKPEQILFTPAPQTVLVREARDYKVCLSYKAAVIYILEQNNKVLESLRQSVIKQQNRIHELTTKLWSEEPNAD